MCVDMVICPAQFADCDWVNECLYYPQYLGMDSMEKEMTNALKSAEKFQWYPVRVRLDLDILLIKGRTPRKVRNIVRYQLEDLIDEKRGFKIRDVNIELLEE